jgi:glycosyltransferase involved in cell wall biosynthesis
MQTKKPNRIMFLTPHNPYGDTYGAQLRALHVGRALCEVGQVTLGIVHLWGKRDGADKTMSDALTQYNDVRFFHLYEMQESGLYEKFRRNFGGGLDNAFKLTCDQEEKRSFFELAEKQDIVWYYGLRIPSALMVGGVNSKPKTFIDIDDIPSQFLESAARNSTDSLNSMKLSTQAGVWRRREHKLTQLFSGLGVCSETDRNYLGNHPAIHVIPNGFEKPVEIHEYDPAEPVRIGFIGTLEYQPNADGVRWFIENVWPKIKERIPAARLRLVGSGTDGEIAGSGPDVDGLGFVAETSGEIATWSMMVVPVFVGGGTRLKIAEGFSRRCPVVSTSLGAYGYDVSDGTELLIADAAETFADACLRIIENPSYAGEITQRAWRKFLVNWTWDAVYPRVWDAVEDCLTCK